MTKNSISPCEFCCKAICIYANEVFKKLNNLSLNKPTQPTAK